MDSIYKHQSIWIIFHFNYPFVCPFVLYSNSTKLNQLNSIQLNWQNKTLFIKKVTKIYNKKIWYTVITVNYYNSIIIHNYNTNTLKPIYNKNCSSFFQIVVLFLLLLLLLYYCYYYYWLLLLIAVSIDLLINCLRKIDHSKKYQKWRKREDKKRSQ